MCPEYLLLNLYKQKSSWKFLFFIAFVYTFSSSSVNSASIMTLSSLSTSEHFQLLTNNSYQYFYLREYFINLLNISHSSLIQSMIENHHLIPKLEQIQTRRRRQISFPSLIRLYSTNCLITTNDQIQTTFHWSYSLESFSSIELIYHINSKISSLPLYISIKQSQTLIDLFSINTYLNYDSIREFYFVNLSDYFLRINDRNVIIEIILYNQTCQTTHGYFLFSSFPSKEISSTAPPPTTKCKLKTIPIKFEELGLADLILRPKEYTFTYCDGTCSNPFSPLQSTLHSFLQSIIRKTYSNIPQSNCVPSHYSDDHFLLRQTDGTMEIYPIKNAIVKQCACL